MSAGVEEIRGAGLGCGGGSYLGRHSRQRQPRQELQEASEQPHGRHLLRRPEAGGSGGKSPCSPPRGSPWYGGRGAESGAGCPPPCCPEVPASGPVARASSGSPQVSLRLGNLMRSARRGGHAAAGGGPSGSPRHPASPRGPVKMRLPARTAALMGLELVGDGASGAVNGAGLQARPAHRGRGSLGAAEPRAPSPAGPAAGRRGSECARPAAPCVEGALGTRTLAPRPAPPPGAQPAVYPGAAGAWCPRRQDPVLPAERGSRLLACAPRLATLRRGIELWSPTSAASYL